MPADCREEDARTIHITLYGPPIGKPRMTRRDKWARRPPVMKYRAWSDRLKKIAGEIPEANKVRLLSWLAVFEPAKSHSKKKRESMMGTLHRNKSDRDNIDKAILDSLYPAGDSGIAMGLIEKRWGEVPRLEIFITKE